MHPAKRGRLRRCSAGVDADRRVAPAFLTASVVPFFSAFSPTGYSHMPAARTLTTKSRSAAVTGPAAGSATTRDGALPTFWTPSMAG